MKGRDGLGQCAPALGGGAAVNAQRESVVGDDMRASNLPSTQALALSPCRVNGDPCLGRLGGLTVPPCSSREVERGVRGCLSLTLHHHWEAAWGRCFRVQSPDHF